MKGYQFEELTGEDKKVFSILDNVPNPYNIFSELKEVYNLHVVQEEEIQIQQHDWQTPLGLVIKKGD